ncbi:hypothetical protein BISA_0388 [Bifidobacterium saguini DSM 23967]|uniref:Uncharacterized protein n=2 Tax=Bifidobacterium TaxID=1678 RepID=A0A087DAZ6_9BIFI|nr:MULTISPECIES: NAD(P)H-dependent oxidoreductase [Bifidobacterium]KFI92696.1 hypothetical protein BISA_0388 [Bifidobacterium saguini DSM 23967]PLS25038.1 flavin reductase [Bifidobacterium imperatoris]
MTKLLFVVGSLHKNGFNHQLADEGKTKLAAEADAFLKFVEA